MIMSKTDFNRILSTNFSVEEQERMELRRKEGGFESVYDMFKAAEKYEKSLTANWWKILLFSIFLVTAIMSI